MGKTIFQILDATSLDVEDGAETETTRELIPHPSGNLSDDDGEMKPMPSRYKKKTTDEEAPVYPWKLRMNIILSGKTPEGVPVCASVEGFRPFFFVRLPDTRKDTRTAFTGQLNEVLQMNKKSWLNRVLSVEFLERKLLYGFTAGKRFPFVKLSVPSLAAFRSLRRFFIHQETSKPVFHLYEGENPLEVYEANLDPMLRFFHLRNIKPCGWVTTDYELDDGDLTTNWEEISPCEGPVPLAPFLMAAWDIECYSANGEFPVPTRGYDRLAKQLYAAADSGEMAAKLILSAATGEETPGVDALVIKEGSTLKLAKLEKVLATFSEDVGSIFMKREGMSISARDERIGQLRDLLKSNLRLVLPLSGDPIIQIGVVLVRGADITEKHIFVLGSCDEVPGAIVHSCKTEKELIINWAKAMTQWNPDILMGYNVFGFDEKYLWDRSKELAITECLQPLSRFVNFDKKVTLEEKFLSSSAMGDNTMYILSTHGRLQIDLFHYIKRSFSLPAYKLDYVCQHFMSGKCSGVDTSDPTQWIVKTKATGDAVIGRYVVLLDETGDTVVEKLKILDVRSKEALVLEAPTGDDKDDLIASVADVVKWAVVKDDVSPQDIFTLHRGGGSTGRAKVAAYCIQDCDLTVELYKKLDVFNNAMAMANACSVPVGYIFTRGQGIKIESLIFKECYEREQCVQVLETQPHGSQADEQDSYEGAIVLTPKAGFYFKSPIGVADFASLYPSTIISENISHDMLVWAKDYDLGGKFIGFQQGCQADENNAPAGTSWTDIEFDVWGTKEGDTRKNPEKVKRGIRVCRYAQNTRGTLPDIVQKLLAARKAKRKEAEKESDPFKKALLDAEQLAYKLTANSLYGQLGSGTFKIRLQHLAASVTAYGRKQIMFANDVIERFYGEKAGRPDCAAKVVYGDTDSLFVDFCVRNPKTGEPLEGREAIVATMALTEEAGKLVSSCLKPPHDFEYDKVFSPFIIFSKKRYVGNKYEESPDEFYQNSMGIATKRRDYAGIVKVIYGGAIRILLSDRDPIAAATFVQEKLMDLADGKVSKTQLTMTKSLRAEYKAVTPPAHKILAERIKARDPGNAPASGDRISFLYILPTPGQQASKLQGERIETPSWIKEKRLDVDAKFYMEHQLMNPISQLFALIVEELPGCMTPTGRPWSEATESDRESAAINYLFARALARCDQAAVKRGAAALGLRQVSARDMVSLRTRSQLSTPQPPKIQMNIKSMFAQKMIIQSMLPPSPKQKDSSSSVSPLSSPSPTPSLPVKKATKKKATGAASTKIIDI